MTFKSPISVDNFAKIREKGYTYIDKSLFIEEVLEQPAEVQLILRPRRFGKTLNMSLLAHFFDCRRDHRHLFKGLNIEQRPCFERCGSHPTLFLNFKNLNEPSFAGFVSRFKSLVAELYIDHDYLLEHINPLRRETFLQYAKGDVDEAQLKDALKWLTKQLAAYHGKGVVLLIDEYDSPILEGYRKDYYPDIIDFMREVLSTALKSNDALDKAVLTGILRVSKESIFSGLNHVEIYSVQSSAFADKFGFTESETLALLNLIGHKNKIQDVQDWYNGYQIGTQTIYNPWSLLKFLQEPQHMRYHWLNTSSNHLVYKLLLQADTQTQSLIAQLMKGKTIATSLKPNTSFRDLDGRALWTLLLYSGYLTIEKETFEDQLPVHHLRIPNREVLWLYQETFIDWLGKGMGQEGMSQLLKALTTGDIDTFGIKLADLIKTVFSYYDTTGSTPERVYHAFLLGLLSHIGGSYHIRSNRESDFGRYDLMMIPKDPKGRGIVMEFKTADEVDGLDDALQAGQAQIKAQNYRAELEAQGIAQITEIAVAFCGKQVRVLEA